MEKTNFDAIIYVGRYSTYVSNDSYGTNKDRNRRFIAIRGADKVDQLLYDPDEAINVFRDNWSTVLKERASIAPVSIIFNQVPPHLSNTNIVTSCQHGFRLNIRKYAMVSPTKRRKEGWLACSVHSPKLKMSCRMFTSLIRLMRFVLKK